MSTQIFSVGDLVTLKSGGPQMVIESLGEQPADPSILRSVGCCWFNKDEQLGGRLFPQEALSPVATAVPANEPAPPPPPAHT